MSKLLKYLLLTLYTLFCAGNLCAASDHDANEADDCKYVAEQLIRSFCNSLGFNVLNEVDSASVNSDSLLVVLENDKEYETYFKLSRIVVKYRILQGKIRMAIAQSDMMYSKAKAQDHILGMALSLNAIGEVYTAMGIDKEAGEVYERSLEIFERYAINNPMKKVLMVELIEYYLRMKDLESVAKYITILNAYPDTAFSELENAVLYIFNAYYRTYTGDLDVAGEYLDKARQLESGQQSGIRLYFAVAEAFYLRQKGNEEEAMQCYNRFFEMKNARNNYALYISAMEDKAELLVAMGRKEEAFELYRTIYTYINSVFKANYPEEIDQLSARFQADQLTYRIEQARNRSLRYSLWAVVGCVCVLVLFIFLSWRKIFRLRQSKKNLEMMKMRAESAIRKKNLFLSNMSHEVRTPLNAIVGFSTLMASEEMDVDEESRKEYCEIIRINSYHLLKLINDIIDFSDFDEDNISMNIKEYDAVKICREVIETIAASYKLKVELSFETSLPALIIETDDSRLRQVLINLLVNATKFTTEGSIVLRLEISPDDHRMAMFSVTDTGCGIPIEKQRLIFERFEKLNDFVQGTGLGLSICLLILKRLKGRIWIDEKYTGGARFCFVHPIKNESKHAAVS